MAQRRCTYTIDMDKKILQCVNNDKYKMTLPDGSERILWSKISKLHFPELGHRSVRQRFMRVLNPDLNKDPFSGEEDVQLLRLVKRFKTSWSLILPHMPGRSGLIIFFGALTITRCAIEQSIPYFEKDNEECMGEAKEDEHDICPFAQACQERGRRG